MQGAGWGVPSRINSCREWKRSRLTGEEVRPRCLTRLPDLANKHRVNFEFEMKSEKNFRSKMSHAIFRIY